MHSLLLNRININKLECKSGAKVDYSDVTKVLI